MSKKLLFVLYLIFQVGFLFGQESDIVIFSEAGERFYLKVNGNNINDEPQSRVEAFNLTGDMAMIRVTFETAGAPVLSRQMLLENGMLTTATVKKNRKGKYILRNVSIAPKKERTERTVEVPVVHQTTRKEVDPSPETQYTPHQTTEEVVTETPGTDLLKVKYDEEGEVSVKFNMPGSRIKKEKKTSSVVNSPEKETAIQARVEGNKILLSDGRTLDWKYTKTKRLTGVEVEMKDPINAQIAISYDGKVAYESEVPFFYREPDWKKSRDYFKVSVREPNGNRWSVKLQHSSNYRILIDNLTGAGQTETVVVEEITEKTKTAPPAVPVCNNITQENLERAIQSINNKSFAEEKMTVANQVVNANCFSVDQVRKLMQQFIYESDKIKLAKLLYPKTTDQNNFYQVNDEFTYSDSVDELNRFLQSQ
ncbi:MAG: DUF4476 domain-containing protein [Bacteroidota bacterium]